MRRRGWWMVGAAGVVLAGTLLAAPVPLAAGRVTAQPTGAGIRPIAVDLGTLGGIDSAALALNDRSQVMGISRTGDGGQNAFVVEGGVLTDLGPANGLAYSDLINARGQVLVNRFTEGKMQAAIWDHGKFTDLPTLGGDLVVAAAINNAGQVVGTSRVATGESHAFLWDNGVMKDLGTLDRSASSATAINEAGEVVGQVEDSTGSTHAFLWAEGVMTDLGTLGGRNSLAAAINDAGEVVGRASTAAPTGEHAFLWADGVMTDLDPRRGGWSNATAVNARGQVIGQQRVAQKDTLEAFIWADGVMSSLGTLGGKSAMLPASMQRGKWSATAGRRQVRCVRFSGRTA